MPALTVKNIPQGLYQKLKDSAKAHHRSLNSELIFCLENTLMPTRVAASERIRRAQALRSGVPDGEISAADIAEAIDKGRP